MGQVQFAGVGKKLVTEAATRAAPHHTDDMGAVGQGHFDQDIAGVRGEVEASRLLKAVFAEAHI